MKQFQNPADYIIKLVQAPELCNLDLNFEYLLDIYQKDHAKILSQEMTKDLQKFSSIHTNLDDFAESRQQGFFTQFSAIFARNW